MNAILVESLNEALTQLRKLEVEIRIETDSERVAERLLSRVHAARFAIEHAKAQRFRWSGFPFELEA